MDEFDESSDVIINTSNQESDFMIDINDREDDLMMDTNDFESNIVTANSFNINDKYPHFICLGEVKVDRFQCHADSYLKRQELLKVLNKQDPYHGNFNLVLNEFFGFRFLTETCLSDSLEQLFYTLKMKYNKIKHHATELTQQITSKVNDKEYLEDRLQIVKFLAFIKFYVINNVNEETSENEISSLLNHVKSLLLHVGRIAQSTVYITLQSNTKSQTCSPLYHLYHLNLDILWSIGAILYALPLKFSMSYFMKITDDTNMQSQSLIIQYTSLIIWDLILLAVKRFQKISLHQYVNSSPFSCSCIAEFWILFVNLLDEIQRKQRGKSFWSYIQLIFNGILYEKLNNSKNKDINSDVFEIEPRIECEDRLGFCWWLLLHLSSLNEVNAIGLKSPADAIKSNYTLLQTLIALSIQSEKVGEAQMRCYLNCCIKICKNWEPNADVLLSLWNHFIRHINSNFCLPYSLEGFQTLCDSGDSWVKLLKGRLSNISNSDNSFYLFLNFFNEKINELNEWKQFKTRIFSKLDSKLMQDLNETGLHNFVTILLTVACKRDVECAVEKMVEFVETIPISCRTSSQKMITWCGMFALLDLREEKQIDQSSFITKLTTEFIGVTQQLKNNKIDVMERQQVMKLILLYIQGIESLIQKSKFLNLSEHLLLNSGINNVLCNGNIEEIEKTLSMTEVVLSKLRMTFMRCKPSAKSSLHELNAMATALSKHILPFVKQYCTTQTPPATLADVAAGFTLLVYDMKLPIDLVSLFHHFGLNSNIQPHRYLCHVLHQNILTQNLHIDRNNVQYLLIGSWFRCVISLSESNDCVCELTRLITKLPEMQSILNTQESDDDDKIFVKFLRALDSKFKTFYNFTEKMAFKQNTEIIFKDILKHNGTVLKNFEPMDQLRQIYIVSAHIVKHCSLIIYVKSKADGSLHTIIHHLLLPRIIYCHDKPLPPNLPIVLRDTLHLFVEGLMKLGPQRDTCINNRLKDIVTYYILRFPLVTAHQRMKLGSSGIQPLLMCLKKSNNSNLDGFFSIALEAIKDQLTTRKGAILITYIKFIYELYTNIPEKEGQIAQIFFVPLLNLLNQPDPNLKDKTCTLISKMVTSIQNSESTKSSVLPLLSKFIQENMYSTPQNVFKLMEMLAQIQPEFVIELVPDLGKCIEKAEEKRGVGQDSNLRYLQQNLLKKLSFTHK